MGLFDKDKLKELGDKAAGAVKKVGGSIKDSAQKTSGELRTYQAECNDAKAPVEGAIRRYDVVYAGGLSEYPKKMSGAIGFNILADRFVLKPTKTTQDKFKEMCITYDQINDFKIIKRAVSVVEGLIADNTANITTENTMEINFTENSEEKIIRLEMLSGVTVHGQAIKCTEMLDFLRREKILDQITARANMGETAKTADDIPAQIEKLAKLKSTGIITEEEFNAKKAELLAKM